jgi:hypothetical protein
MLLVLPGRVTHVLQNTKRVRDGRDKFGDMTQLRRLMTMDLGAR